MTEEVQGSESASQGTGTVAPVSTPPAPTPPAEKLLTQTEVNDVVKREKFHAYEKGKQEALAAQNSGNTQYSGNVQPTYQPPQQMGGMITMSEAEMNKRIAEGTASEVSKYVNQVRTDQLIYEYTSKMNRGPDKYPEFEAKVLDLKLENMPNVVRLANSFDITEDIVWDLANNPIKAANFDVLAQKSPQAALKEMQKLANSIKENQAAATNQPNVAAPLSQVKPSTAGMDNGNRTISDKRKNPKYRI